MLFNSVSFLIFFPIVVLGYFIIPEKCKNLWLLVASYYFYMSWQPVYALLILFSTISTFTCGILIDSAREKKTKKLYLAFNIFINIAILFYFKYFNFFVETLLSLFPTISIAKNNNMLAVVGISFYTFQSLGYCIDVYTGKTEKETNFLNYALFVSFFPQLVAGPIERSTNFLPQLKKTYRFDYDRVTDGMVLMAWGFFKKLAIADTAALLVNAVYNDVTRFTGIQLILATVLFAFQIYCDFSGYSDIAIGAANILGFKLMRNFYHPYFAQSVVDFWRRWHISLSGWFMDYIYIPLGGSRKGEIRTYINLMITFLVSGLWHGAAYTFIVWGALNGLYNICERLILKYRRKHTVQQSENRKRVKQLPLYRRVLNALGTFVLIDFSWIFFRANSLTDAVYVIKNLFSDITKIFMPGYITGALVPMGFFDKNGWAILLCIVIMLLVEMWEGKSTLVKRINNCCGVVRWLFYYSVIILIMLFGYFGQSQFIYFQF